MIDRAPWKPDKRELDAAKGKTIADLIRPDLRVLFCGINPSLYSAAVGHHFARPGNRFWPVLHEAGFINRRISSFEESVLLDAGYGITNLVDRATAKADELMPQEFEEGGRNLERKVAEFRPRIVAFLGVGAYRTAFHRAAAVVGRQSDVIGSAALWVLPNPSGLNAHYQKADLVLLFRSLREAAHSLLGKE